MGGRKTGQASESKCPAHILKQANLSWKKCKKCLAKADPEKRIQFVEQFQVLYARMLRGEVRIIYIDEAHIHQDMDLGYTWSPKGEPAWRSSTSPGRGKRINWYGAYDFTEGRTFIWEDGMCDGEHTIQFLQRLSTWLDESDRQVVIIWDGASYHRSEIVQAALQDLGFQLLPLPSYSPDLNPSKVCGNGCARKSPTITVTSSCTYSPWHANLYRFPSIWTQIRLLPAYGPNSTSIQISKNCCSQTNLSIVSSKTG